MTEPKTLDEIAERFVLREMLEPLQIPAGRSAMWVRAVHAALQQARDLGRAERDKEWQHAVLPFDTGQFTRDPKQAGLALQANFSIGVREAVAEEREALRKRWAYGDEENGQGVYVEWRGRRFGQGPELWAVTRLSWCLNRSGEWEIEPQPSSRDDAFIARCRWHSMQEALLAALDAREEPTIGQDGPAAEAAREVKGHTEIIDDALDARDSAPAEPGKPE